MKLLAIDGLSVLRPIFEANSEPDITKRAQDALDNALSSFGRLLGAHLPSHVLAAFDAGGNTWRHALYPRYRENRVPMAAELRDRIPEFLVRLVVWHAQFFGFEAVQRGWSRGDCDEDQEICVEVDGR